MSRREEVAGSVESEHAFLDFGNHWVGIRHSVQHTDLARTFWAPVQSEPFHTRRSTSKSWSTHDLRLSVTA